MTKEEATAEITRLNKIADAISPEYLRLQKVLTLLSDKIQYCQGIIEGKPVKTSEELITEIESEVVKEAKPEAKDEPAEKPAPL